MNSFMYEFKNKIYINNFSFEIGLLNALSYLIIVLSVTYVDSSYDHIIYGHRYYTFGYSVGWLSVIIFGLTVLINSRINTKKEFKAIGTFLIVIIPNVILNFINFVPEFPHAIVIFGSIIYELIISLLVYLHNVKLGEMFLDNDMIDKSAKIERIKMDYDMWQKFLFALIAGFSIWILTWLEGVKEVGLMVAKLPADQELVRTHIIFLTFIFSFLCLRLLIEVIKKLIDIRNQLGRIVI